MLHDAYIDHEDLSCTHIDGRTISTRNNCAGPPAQRSMSTVASNHRRPGRTSLRGGRLVLIIVGAIGSMLMPPSSAHATDPVAVDSAAAAGMTWVGPTQGTAAVFDFDKDGDDDVVPSRHGGAPWPIMRNNGNGTFTEVSRGALDLEDRHGCIAGDFGTAANDGHPDGRLDLYCIVGGCRGSQFCSKENDLVFQLPTGGFSRNQAVARGVADIHGRARQAMALDFDKDGLLDLAVANYGPSYYPTPNRLFRNNGNGTFTDVTSSPVHAEKRSLCGAAGDLDGDGWPDLLFCTGDSNDTIRTLTYHNDKGSFVDVTASTSYRTAKSRSIKIIDLNRDGRMDLIIVEQTRLKIWLNGAAGLPAQPSYVRAITEGRDVAAGDVNKDGKLDLYVCTGWNGGTSQQPDLMLINDGDSRSFHPMAIPQATAGDGDAVAVIPDWKHSGRAAFLVSNSKSGSAHNPGPTQLITFANR